MATVRGGKVRPHVQAFADACQKATGASSYGTYPGHQPTLDRALDIFHGVNDTRLSAAVCDFALQNWEHFGLDYIISRRRIYNPEISRSWRLMADRGGVTQNHEDHVHVSFEPVGAATSGPSPKPIESIESEENDMIMIWHKGALYLLTARGRTPWGLQPHAADALKAAGVKVGGNPNDDQSNLFDAIDKM
ncbi:MAG: hypothetical protein LC798_05220 [Chloroflexi bacterium]|nr:hypothetical protein [Chloroflexota bacterium]